MKNFQKATVAFLTLFLSLCFAFSVSAQLSISTGHAPAAPKEDTTKPVSRSAIKPYDKVVTSDFISKWGLFAVHQSKDKIYFEIPDSLLNLDIMVINRLSMVPGGHGMYGGEELDQRTIQFEKAADSTIKVRFTLVISEADSNQNIFKAVSRSSVNPIVTSFPILTYGKNSTVVDASRFLKDKSSFVNTIDATVPLATNINVSGLRDINVESVRAYPLNVEISISKNTESRAKIIPAGTPATIVTNASFIALPKRPMQRRYFDPRVGFFADYFFSFGDNQQKAESLMFAVRWRLEPKPEDMDRWKKGELVEPAKPIIIYIDPATPKQWRPYLIKGVDDWQAAFEHAGFKNAIIGKEWPENDTTMSMEDARFSMINYLPSEVANAYGPNVHDPRSGEIIQTHIGWFHNVMELLNNWYVVQASAVDPRARKPKFDESLMGELIRFVSSHEVGHTLGLRHNFGSSSQTPVDSLRSKTYLEKNGHTASIMDYARFNYVIQPEDNPTAKHIFPKIGEYDKWAIEWGYKYIGAPTADDDKKVMARLTTAKNAASPRVWFGDGEKLKFDPRCQTEDLGDNAMKASAYGIKNLQRIVPNLPEWTAEEGGLNENLPKMYVQIQNQYFRYMGHVLKNIGGVRYTVRSDADKAAAYEPVPRAMQLEAVTFFNNQLFKTPDWLLNKTIIDRTTLPQATNFVEDLQVRVLNTLLDIEMMKKMMASEKQFGNQAFPIYELIATLHKGIWDELKNPNVKIDIYRRNLQKSYVGAMVDLMMSKDPANTESDASSVVRADLLQLENEIKTAISKATEPMTIYHLKDLQDRVKNAAKPKSL